ncbi:HD domain-containing phosphohydrolase [Acidovorax sp. NB1]|uniref:HD domain-containing phosphohydrolase n=1 Tax=Acidovorax sp. NB1 TaxID=1943571 RepID=UPI0035CF0F5D
MMIRDTKAAEVAVLEHHERLDGSGYPRGLASADITPMGPILLLAEAFAYWDQLKVTLSPGTAKALADSAFAFADSCLLALQKALIDASPHTTPAPG